jgi:hypothetical protein
VSNLKPGYLLKITTWENDGDNYNTKELHGLSEMETNFVIDVCELFYSCNGWGAEDVFGNADAGGDTYEICYST